MSRPRSTPAWSGAMIGVALDAVKSSYWFIPALLTVAAVLLSLALVRVDIAVGALDGIAFPAPSALGADAAQTLMQILTTSILGVTGVMFSMTIVAVSFATGKYGPRLIGNFLRDRVNQWSLGTLTATFVFSVLVTRTIRSAGPGSEAFVPHLSILVAVVLTLLCVGVVVFFVHHIPETIDISRITAALGRRIMDDTAELAEGQSRAARAGDPGFTPPGTAPAAELPMGETGYVEALDVERLTTLAREFGLGIVVVQPVGSYATDASTALRIWGALPDEELRARLMDCFATGDGPTDRHNLLHLFDQLVEITARALSPGVNDPFTAINCLNWMRAGATVAANHADGLTGAQSGPVHVPPLRFDHVLAAGFGASRSYTRSDPLTDRHLRDVLTRLAQDIRPGPHLDTLHAFVKRLDGDGDP